MNRSIVEGGGSPHFGNEPEGLFEGFFADAPVPGDVEATLTGGQVLADEFGTPSQQAQAIAAGGSPTGVAVAQGAKSAASAVAGAFDLLPMILIVAGLVLVVILVQGGKE